MNNKDEIKIHNEKDIELLIIEKHGKITLINGFVAFFTIVYLSLKKLIRLSTYLDLQKSQRVVMMEKAEQPVSITAPAKIKQKRDSPDL